MYHLSCDIMKLKESQNKSQIYKKQFKSHVLFEVNTNFKRFLKE